MREEYRKVKLIPNYDFTPELCVVGHATTLQIHSRGYIPLPLHLTNCLKVIALPHAGVAILLNT